MKRIAALALAVLPLPAFAGGPVMVADEPMVAAPQPVAVVRSGGDWSGFYAGGQLGFANTEGDIPRFDSDGAIGGVHVGYRMDFGGFVTGAELAYDVTSIGIEGAEGDQLDSMASIKLIAGADLGRAIVYGTVGASMVNATIGGVSEDGRGTFGGIGMDYAISERLTVGGQLLRHNIADLGPAEADLSATTLQAKVSFRF